MEEKEQKKTEMKTQATIAVVAVVAAVAEACHRKAELNLLCLVWSYSMGYWFCFIRDKNKYTMPANMVSYGLSARDDISKHRMNGVLAHAHNEYFAARCGIWSINI